MLMWTEKDRDPVKRRAHFRERSRRRRAEAKEFGLCQWCGVATRGAYCDKHAKAVATRQRERYHRLKGAD